MNKQVGRVAEEKLLDALKEHESHPGDEVSEDKTVHLSRSFAGDLCCPGSRFCKPEGIAAVKDATVAGYKIVIEYDQQEDIRFD